MMNHIESKTNIMKRNPMLISAFFVVGMSMQFSPLNSAEPGLTNATAKQPLKGKKTERRGPLAEAMKQLADDLKNGSEGTTVDKRSGTSKHGRGTGALPSVAVLPFEGTIAETTLEQPTLFWFQSAVGTKAKIRLALCEIGPNVATPLLDKYESKGEQIGGLNWIDLKEVKDINITLEPKKRYKWSAGFVPDQNDHEKDRVAMVIISRVKASPALTAELEKASSEENPEEKISDVYVRHGFWYDAVQILNKLRTSLLEQGKDSADIDGKLSDLLKRETQKRAPPTGRKN